MSSDTAHCNLHASNTLEENPAPARCRAAVIRSFPNRVLKITVFSSRRYSRPRAHFNTVPSHKLDSERKRSVPDAVSSEWQSQLASDSPTASQLPQPSKRKRISSSQISAEDLVTDTELWDADAESCVDAL
eukprot:CAMPEP_0202821372 /NCGR_PEP_ID=MMETSP1389-20130828/10334_1 /ASSEMBLY_ACC=CAM_ASM_000865 /TAXON_ID=302021 /ORGANISM="Rhodomonas sp., Strain CCMP768" /LENGTH=130 /DNA_ID=CAMNT_0049494131 /DNA_START=95 /DNA_END=484 /DNA_ORIENTATION=+